MTLELLEFFKRYIQDDLYLIVASYVDFFDELVKDRLPFFKAGSLIAACPGKQIAAVAFSLFVFQLDRLLLFLCIQQSILCRLDCFFPYNFTRVVRLRLRKQLAEKDEVIDILKKSVGILSKP